MNHAVVQSVAPGSAAELAGVLAGDELVAVSGREIRDIIEYRWMTDEDEVSLDIQRGGLELTFDISKPAGDPLGIEIDSPVFDEVRTCDNHCEFCFIYQLPPGMRRSLYLKDDDYRLSFLYGNFTTLTRFTEADMERVLTEGLSPLYVSIHATDPEVRSEMLRNRRGGMSLRWLRALLAEGIEVHGQIVVCPGINDGTVLEDSFTGILDEYPELADVAVVPLGVSKFNTEQRMRPHTTAEAQRVLDLIEAAQQVFMRAIGRPMIQAADEYYLLAGRPFPKPGIYGDFGMHEDGIGMASAFELEFRGELDQGIGVQPGFFNWVDGAPAEGYRAPRTGNASPVTVQLSPRQPKPGHNAPEQDNAPEHAASEAAPLALITGVYGARVLQPIVDTLNPDDVRIITVDNQYFGGNIGVTGLMVGQDVARALGDQPLGHRYLLPDVCLSRGVFLDGMSPEDLPRSVEIIATDGISLRGALRESKVNA